MNKEDLVILKNQVSHTDRYWVTGFHHPEYGMVVQEVSTDPRTSCYIDAEERNKGYFCVPSDYNPLGKRRRVAKPYPFLGEV